MAVRERDYDQAAAARQEIRLKVLGEWIEYPAEAPIDVAIEWMDRQTQLAKDLDESPAEYAEANWKLIMGSDHFEAWRKRKIGAKVIDEIYRDLLDWWDLWPRPEVRTDALHALLDELEVQAEILLSVGEGETAVQAHAKTLEVLTEIRDAIGGVVGEEDADEQLEEAEAGNSA